MKEEKRSSNTVWFSYEDYAFKVNMLDNGNAVVWVNYKGYNVAFSMIIRDFLYNMEDYNCLNVIINCDWKEHRGFEVKQEEIHLLIGEILNFCIENEPKTMDLMEKYSGDEWYE
ncbi:hypothetical protein [Lysinibacillus sp. OF-1]|uniref:hypothetical protein n=1 Tax=Lysinibacillus sp. OF-1 TaxID=2972483 RepID=UPI00232BBAC7|nr:hypothetical protein [Lysinibacillus sp. OF-1]WCH46214.1 hypothetical protein NV349_14035 [Lysinibacillus sp. OF-1]